ncbi:hypothetical protein [Fontivita pretiosa]|uniref:hypothetical protein n=1 Tax=Fontivita pretiosa TaxID=2989684 RepID=UPI003D17B56F
MDKQYKPTTDPNDVKFADSVEILRRKSAFDRFVDRLFEPELRPFFVSDEANIFDISGDTTEEIVEKIRQSYGRTLNLDELRMPLWKLLDFLEGKQALLERSEREGGQSAG